MSNKKLLINNETVDQLIFILESKPTTLTQFEINFINGTFKRYKGYGSKTHLSGKQAKVIADVFRKVKIVNLKPLLEPLKECETGK